MEITCPDDVIKAFDQDGYTVETLERFISELELIGDTDWRYLLINVILNLVSQLKKLDQKHYTATPNSELRDHHDMLEKEMLHRSYGYLLLQSPSNTTKNLAPTKGSQSRTPSPELELPKKIPLYLNREQLQI